jgi:ABC-type arginine transport system ATPase subunit
MAAVVDALSRLDIDRLKIQENKEESLTLISGSEQSSINIIKLLIQMNNALIFKEQSKDGNQGITRKVISLTSLLNTTY